MGGSRSSRSSSEGRAAAGTTRNAKRVGLKEQFLAIAAERHPDKLEQFKVVAERLAINRPKAELIAIVDKVAFFLDNTHEQRGRKDG